MRILLVEDDALLGDGVKTSLLNRGYVVDWFRDGIAADQALRTEIFDIIVLDIGLPRMSGLEILKALRERGTTTPVLLLTARETVEDLVKGLDTGADDYLTKPFDLDELFARLRALQRRSGGQSATLITYGVISLDTNSHTVTLDGNLVVISRREFALLQKLLQSAGRVLSREQLVQTMYGWGEEIDSNALEVHIHNLRKKFGADLINTIRGVGYIVQKIE
jgi:two-component system response regulator QseB